MIFKSTNNSWQRQHEKKIVQFQMKLAQQTEPFKVELATIESGVNQFIEAQSMGQYMIKINEEDEIVGYLLYINENPKIRWLQAAYVQKKDRKKGVFRELFLEYIALAKTQNIEELKICVEGDNLKAIQIYKKYSFEIIGQCFYIYDFVFGYNPQTLQFTKKIPPIYNFSTQLSFQNLAKILQNLHPLMQKKPQCLNKQLICEKDGQIQFYCEYYDEYSIWRDGTCVNITSLFVGEENPQELLSVLLRYLYQDREKIRMLKFQIKNKEDTKFMKYVPKGEYELYEVMSLHL